MNAREKLLAHIKGQRLVAAQIEVVSVVGRVDQEVCLYPKYTTEELAEFLNALNIEYDDDGIEHLLGSVWFTDGTCHEYDGATWWVCMACPPLPCRD
jgi:ABC-type multidrug transport system ATPase subunit